MERSRLRDLLERYGADPNRFPEGEREAAKALLESEPELAVLVKEARSLDDLLALSATAPPSAVLLRRVAEIPLRHTRPMADMWSLRALLGPSRQLWRAALATVAAAALGMGGGLVTRPGANAPEPSARAAIGVEAWDDFAALAFADDLALATWDDEETP